MQARAKKIRAALRRAAAAVRSWTQAHGRDVGHTVAGLAGVAGIAVGFYLAWAPLGWIVGGLELVGFTALTARRPPEAKPG